MYLLLFSVFDIIVNSIYFGFEVLVRQKLKLIVTHWALSSCDGQFLQFFLNVLYANNWIVQEVMERLQTLKL